VNINSNQVKSQNNAYRSYNLSIFQTQNCIDIQRDVAPIPDHSVMANHEKVSKAMHHMAEELGRRSRFEENDLRWFLRMRRNATSATNSIQCNHCRAIGTNQALPEQLSFHQKRYSQPVSEGQFRRESFHQRLNSARTGKTPTWTGLRKSRKCRHLNRTQTSMEQKLYHR
jgi:hypothetical protein